MTLSLASAPAESDIRIDSMLFAWAASAASPIRTLMRRSSFLLETLTLTSRTLPAHDLPEGLHLVFLWFLRFFLSGSFSVYFSLHLLELLHLGSLSQLSSYLHPVLSAVSNRPNFVHGLLSSIN